MSLAAAWLERGQAAWPGVKLGAEAFSKHLHSLGVVPEHSEGLEVEALYLTGAALAGDAEAWRILDAAFLSRIPMYLRGVVRSDAAIADVRQRVTEKLLAGGKNQKPKLAQYTGKGTLHGWLKVVAVREAHNSRKGTRPETDDAVLGRMASGGDVENSLLQGTSAEALREAFGVAMGKVGEAERSLLRLHYIDRLSIDEVGQAYGISRATAARRLAEARETILAEIDTHLRTRFGSDAPHAKSLFALAASRLDLSIMRHFAQ